jgi:hypothetical protein
MENLTQNEMDELIRNRYQSLIGYYWNASKSNKRWYKLTRSLTVIFGAAVTLVASLTSSEVIVQSSVAEKIFVIGTPVLAAMLTIIAGFSQSFQWGSTWQNMVITAEELQKELDKYLVTPADQRNYLEEAEKLNGYAITESKGFFDWMLGTATSLKNGAEPDNT